MHSSQGRVSSSPPKPISAAGHPRARIALWGLLLACLGLVHPGCGKTRPPTRPDSIPPAPVGSFVATVGGTDTILLTWIAPGDDGNTGQAAAYDARRSSGPINAENFGQADTLGGLPAPAPAGTQQDLLLTGLLASSTQYFAIRASDERGNWSPPSFAGPTHTAPDTLSPPPITDLHVDAVTDTSIVLAWTARGDDNAQGRVSGYNVRFRGGTLTSANWPSAHEAHFSRIVLVATGSIQRAEVSGITPRVPVQLSVRALDEAGNASTLSNVLPIFFAAGPKTWSVEASGTGMVSTIQAGIDSSRSGDTVVVSPGTYRECIDFGGKDVVVRSQIGPSRTILDATGLGRSVVTFTTSESRGAVIDGFTITGGAGTSDSGPASGGGVYCRDASPIVKGNWIVSNHLGNTSGTGGGAFLVHRASGPPYPSPLFENNTFFDNSADGNGGGIGIFNCSAELRGNLFKMNRTGHDGGGAWVYLNGGGNPEISNNIFEGNVAGDHGGGIEAGPASGLLGATVAITGNLFVGNSAQGNDSPDLDTGTGGGISARVVAGKISHNTLFRNSGTGRSGCTGGGILIADVSLPLEISYNLVVESSGCGICCYRGQFENIKNNLLWHNSPEDLGYVGGLCPPLLRESNLFVNPQICGADIGDFRLDVATPGRVGGEVVGAFPATGCAQIPVGHP